VRRGDGGGVVQLRAVLCGEPLSGKFVEGADTEEHCVQERTLTPAGSQAWCFLA